MPGPLTPPPREGPSASPSASQVLTSGCSTTIVVVSVKVRGRPRGSTSTHRSVTSATASVVVVRRIAPPPAGATAPDSSVQWASSRSRGCTSGQSSSAALVKVAATSPPSGTLAVCGVVLARKPGGGPVSVTV